MQTIARHTAGTAGLKAFLTLAQTQLPPGCCPETSRLQPIGAQ